MDLIIFRLLTAHGILLVFKNNIDIEVNILIYSSLGIVCKIHIDISLPWS